MSDSSNIEEMSLVDIIRGVFDPETTKPKKPQKKPEITRDPSSQKKVKKSPEERTEKAPEVSPLEKEIPELFTPEPDASWGPEQAQEHEDRILENAFSILKSTLQEHGLAFEENDQKPYTLKVEGVLTVQNIMLPWKHDPRVIVFKGIRIVCPEHLKRRREAFRRGCKKGPFNFKGLIERIKLRSREVIQAAEEKEQKAELESRLKAFQEKELRGIPMPSCLTLSRRANSFYDGCLTFEGLSLSAVKSLMKFGNKIESQ